MSKDPGKRVDTWLPTWLWKRLRLAADRKGLTLRYVVADAIIGWCDEQDQPSLNESDIRREERTVVAQEIAVCLARRPWISMPTDGDKRALMKSRGHIPPVTDDEMTIEDAYFAADRILAALYADGNALVPIEPTDAMLEASAIDWTRQCSGYPPENGHYKFMRGLWSAMLAAKP